MFGFILKLGMIFVSIINLIQMTPLTSRIDVDDTDLKSFLNLVKKRGNFTVNPCDDFSKYACGNMEQKRKVKTTHKMATLIEPLFMMNNTHNEAERKVHDMYLSCKKMLHETADDKSKRFFHILEQVNDLKFITDNHHVSSQDISKMFVKFYLLGHLVDPISFNLRKGKFILNVNFRHFHETEVRNLKNILVIGNYEEGVDTLIKFNRKIAVFYEHYIVKQNPVFEIKEDSRKITLKSIDELKKLLPSQNIDWEISYNNFKNEFNITDPEIIVDDIETTKEIINIIDSIDKRTFMNYLTYKYIEFLYKIDCMNLDFYYRYAVLSRLWDDNFGNSVTLDRFLKFLDEFEVMLKNIQDKVQFKIADFVHILLNEKRNTAKNYKKILPNDLRDKFYETLDIDINNYYTNLIKVYSHITKKLNQFNYDNEIVRNSTEFGLFVGRYDDTITTIIKNKPYIHLYTTLNYVLWNDIFRIYRINLLSDYKMFNQCLNQFKDDIFASNEFIKKFTTQRVSFLNILYHSSINSNMSSGLLKEKELLETKYGDSDIKDINMLYFIALAQYKCEETGETTFENYIFWLLQYAKEFSETFDCPSNSKMKNNFVCKIEECDEDMKKYLPLLPYKVEGCQEELFN